MKLFIINDGFCDRDVTRFETLENARRFYPADTMIVEAPDDTFEGWGYKNGEFIVPEAPEGFAYDTETGTLYPVWDKPVRTLDNHELSAENERLKKENADLIQRIGELEDALLELAEVVVDG